MIEETCLKNYPLGKDRDYMMNAQILLNELKPEAISIRSESVSDPFMLAVSICLAVVALYVIVWIGGYVYSHAYHQAKRRFIMSIMPKRLQDEKEED